MLRSSVRNRSGLRGRRACGATCLGSACDERLRPASFGALQLNQDTQQRAVSTLPSVSTVAPVALFVYRKATASVQVLQALARCVGFQQTPVYVFSDGAATEAEAGRVAALRSAIRDLPYPNVVLVERERNLGLAKSIEYGVAQLCEEYGRAIVLEDDHLPAPATLLWFNQALDAYADEDRVGAVSGHIIDVPAICRRGRGVFFWHPASPCWAVWKRSWSLYDPDCTDWAGWMIDPLYRARFRVHGAMRFEHMMRDRIAGRSNSWAIRWHASLVRHRKLVLYPPQSMVLPLETDSRFASNGNRTGLFLPACRPWPGEVPPPLPVTVEIDQWAVKAWANRLRYSGYGAAHALASILYEARHRVEKTV